MKNEYYVYEWIRIDTNEVFYVGKGKGNRAYEINENRNKYFKAIIKNREVAVVILHDNLSEKEAFEYECWYINEYKYEMGINLTNQTDGGDGVAGWFNRLSEEEKKIYSQNMTEILKKRYENDPELKQKISKGAKKVWENSSIRESARKRGKTRHKNNPNFFKEISRNFWRSEEGRKKASINAKGIWADDIIRKKIIESRKNSIKFRKNVHEANSKRFSNSGNPNAKKVTVIIDGLVLKFGCKKEAINYMNEIGIMLISDRTKKPIKKIRMTTFNKKLSGKIYTDYNGKIIHVIEEK